MADAKPHTMTYRDHKSIPVVPHEAVPEVSKGREYYPKEHGPIESFVTTPSHFPVSHLMELFSEQSWHLFALSPHATACDNKF